MTESTARAFRWMLGGAFALATMATMAHALANRCDWLLIALVRIFLTFVFSVGLARMAGARLVVWRPRTLWVRSLAGTCSLGCTFFALARLPVAEVLTLTNTYPIWIVLLSWLRMRRAPALFDVLGVASGVVGVALIQRPHLSGSGQTFAAGVALAGSLATAVAMLGLHRLKEIDPRAVVAHFSGVASVLSGAWLLVRREPLGSEAMSASSIVLLLGIGLTGTIGQVLLTRAYAAGPPTKVAMIALTQVIFGMIFDVALWGRSLSAETLLGTALVLAPAALLTRRAALEVEEVEAAAED
jgi:drug/metabolite transporter (DMT)-like permease